MSTKIVSKKSIIKKRDALIVADFTAGMDYPALCEKYFIPRTTAYTVVSKAGVAKHKKPHQEKLPIEIVEEKKKVTTDYMIVNAKNIKELEVQVKEALKLGFTPLGGIAVWVDGIENVYMQTLSIIE